MEKPVVFFSHSSRDKILLTRLKSTLLEKTGETIEVFLSSDGQSIPLGRNWVSRIEEALSRSAVMFVFLTPSSIQSDWLYFESGFSYAREIRVVPVALPGVDLEAIGPPLGLLQGFNVRSSDGLNNLIAVINEEFHVNHPLSFSSSDYVQFTSTGYLADVAPLGEQAAWVSSVQVHMSSLRSDAEASTSSLLRELELQYQTARGGLHIHGMSIEFHQNGAGTAQIDPSLLNQNLPILDQILSVILAEGQEADRLRVLFLPWVTFLHERYKLTSRLFGSIIGLDPEGLFSFRDIHFSLARQLGPSGFQVISGPTYIEIPIPPRPLAQIPLRELIALLADLEVLYLEQSGG